METELDSDDDPLDLIVAQCLESTAGGLATAVESACRDNPEHALEIRRRVTALRSAGLLELDRLPGDETFPERLGDFRLLQRLGGGGMGVVFRARQEALGREVALKLIRPEHMYFPRARERFRRETEAVARLQHPGIVPIYTVGEEQGVPYFAMELVAGCTLAEVIRDLQGRAPESLAAGDLHASLLHCSPRLPEAGEAAAPAWFEGRWVEVCLRIAIQVARALHHAHGRGVLHRDVKPSNIAVTFDGRAMLLDFGLASLEQEVRVTAQGAALGSLLYMSPEQIRGDADAVDQRSDIYALGVTLYELLTLQVPYFDTNPIGTRQAIFEGRADLIRVRNRAVPKDLETVCFKAMERDATRRYPDAEALARDLTNVLELRPIEARPPSTALRAKRWVQRNPAKSVSLALSGFLVVVAPSALWWLQMRHSRDLKRERDTALAAKRDADEQRAAAERASEQAERERARAELEAREAATVAEFMVDLFGAADPANARGRERTARELLDLGVERIDKELTDQPELQARLMSRMASSYASLGRYEQALPLAERALELRRQQLGEASLPVAESLYQLGLLQQHVGDKAALPTMRRALELRERLGLASDFETARCLVGLANVLTRNGEFDGALELFARARDIRDTLDGDQRKLSELILSNEANTLYNARRYGGAVDVAEQAIAIYRDLYDGPHPGLLACLNTLALSLKNLKRFDEAERVGEELLALGAELHGEESDRYAIFVMNKASLLDDTDRADEAAQQYERALAIFDRTTAPSFPQRITCIANLAGVMLRGCRYARARELYVEALPLVQELYGERSSRYLLAVHNIGVCDDALGDFDAAAESLADALELARTAAKPEPARIARELTSLALLEHHRGDFERARKGFEEALRVAEASGDEAVGFDRFARWGLVRIELEQAHESQAALLALAAEKSQPFGCEWLSSAIDATLATALAANGEHERASELIRGACAELDRRLGPSHPEALDALSRAIAIATAAGRREQADELRRMHAERLASR